MLLSGLFDAARWRESRVLLLGFIATVVVLGKTHEWYTATHMEHKQRLPFPPINPSSSGLPPFPFVDDALALREFFASSLDDAVEDTAKAACVAAAYTSGWASLGAVHPGTARFAGATTALLAYPFCNVFGDTLGFFAEQGLEWAAAQLGVTLPDKFHDAPQTTLISQVCHVQTLCTTRQAQTTTDNDTQHTHTHT
eukprot:m.98822 g.98822  ORF g.98822 m.98822 type:complete len:196 (-) comp13127_c0_seq9:1159-1746(-)